jgi:beta-glucanase (GH16 family)
MGTLTNTNPTPLPNTGWRLTFFDGFDGGGLDRAAWPLVFWGGSNNGAYTFQPGNVVVWDGEASVNSASTPSGWTSGAFQGGWNGQLYGRFEIRARFDPGQGISGALLLWPSDDQGGAEVDLIETRTADRWVNNISVHGNGTLESTEFHYDASQWHTYAVDWLPGLLVFYLDGQEIHRTTNRVPSEMMSLGVLGYVNSRTDLWQGGPPDASSPGFSSIHVDWVRQYTPESLYPGALPTALYGTPGGALRLSTEPWTGTWNAGNFGEYARGAVRSVDGVAYAATWNTAQ